jgi:hypothetical protein
VNGKLAQIPFFFNLEGGLHGQHGQAYLAGVVEADYLDDLPVDIIATERQRVTSRKALDPLTHEDRPRSSRRDRD